MPPARRAYGGDETALRKSVQGDGTKEAKSSFFSRRRHLRERDFVGLRSRFGAPRANVDRRDRWGLV